MTLAKWAINSRATAKINRRPSTNEKSMNLGKISSFAVSGDVLTLVMQSQHKSLWRLFLSHTRQDCPLSVLSLRVTQLCFTQKLLWVSLKTCDREDKHLHSRWCHEYFKTKFGKKRWRKCICDWIVRDKAPSITSNGDGERSHERH